MKKKNHKVRAYVSRALGWITSCLTTTAGVLLYTFVPEINGADDFANAEIAIAKKWGVPYLDINGGYQVPLMLRTHGKSEVCQTAKDLRLSQQRAAVDDEHPNAQAHEYASTFIENKSRW
jgi:hypothetical protein